MADLLPPWIDVLERGWLHGNVVAIRGATPTLVDAGYHTGQVDTLAFVRRALGSDPVQLVLTHVHADHAGGVAHVTAATGAPVHAHPDAIAIVQPWQPTRLWLGHTGQHLPRFHVDQPLGDVVQLGDRRWQVVPTAGHATGGVSFYEPESKVLITGDALWQRGFGVLDPWTDGPDVFDAAAQALDALGALPVHVVVPGHGPPFRAFGPALADAKQRLAYLRTHPERLQAQLVRNLVAFLRLARPEVGAEELATRAHVLADRVGMSEQHLIQALSASTGGY